jgi:hypothetical protein
MLTNPVAAATTRESLINSSRNEVADCQLINIGRAAYCLLAPLRSALLSLLLLLQLLVWFFIASDVGRQQDVSMMGTHTLGETNAGVNGSFSGSTRRRDADMDALFALA